MTIEIIAALTVLFSTISSAGAAWLTLRKQKASAAIEAEEKMKVLKLEQTELESRIKKDQMTAYTTQAELEQKFRFEIREDINRVKMEARHLEKLLHASEDENRSLRRRVMELEMEIVKLRDQLNGYKSAAGSHTSSGEATITLTAERTDAIVIHSEAEAEK